MRVRAVLGSIFGSVAVLVVGWEAGAAAAHNAASLSTNKSSVGAAAVATPSASTPSPASSATPTPTPTPTSSGTTSAGVSGSFVGSTAETPFGPMQVEVVVVAGKITNVKALQITNMGGRSVQISNYAVPILRSEVLAAQSAHVSSVGGATYTSDGYLTSLQSALDKAHL